MVLCRALDAHQNGSLTPGPTGKWARFSPMLCVNLPNNDAPPKEGTPMLEGMNHLPQRNCNLLLGATWDRLFDFMILCCTHTTGVPHSMLHLHKDACRNVSNRCAINTLHRPSRIVCRHMRRRSQLFENESMRSESGKGASRVVSHPKIAAVMTVGSLGNHCLGYSLHT